MSMLILTNAQMGYRGFDMFSFDYMFGNFL